MKLSITTKFVLSLVLLLAISSGTTFFTAFYNYSNTLTDTLSNTISVAQQNFDEITQAKGTDFVASAKLATKYEGLVSAVYEKDAQKVINLSNIIMKDSGASILTITDNKGNVLARAHNNERFGDSISSQSIIASGLQGNSSFAIVDGVAAPSLRATTPIILNNNVIGTLSIGASLSSSEYLDWLGNLLNAHVTFFKDSQRVMTTIQDAQGKRIIGTKLNNPTIENQVLSQGKAYFGNSTIVGEDYIAAYWPVKNYNNNIIGMWFIGLPVSDVLQAKNEAGLTTFISSTIANLLMMVVAVFIAISFSKPIKQIAKYAAAVASGDENAQLKMDKNDEFGVLANSIKTMINKLKEQTHWYKSVLDALPINVSVTDMDKNWVLVNKAGMQGTGKTLEEIIGLPCHTRGGNLCNTPDCGITKLEQGQSQAINIMPNGTVMEMRLSYLYDTKGEKIGHVEVGLNITDKVNAENEAKEKEQQIKNMIVQQIEDIVLTLDNSTTLLSQAIDTAQEDAKNTADYMIKANNAMGEMENTIHDVAQNASQAAIDASDTQNHAENGHKAVSTIVGDILSVQNSSNELKNNMEELSTHAKNIGDILNIIRDIADQTNLLALNAAIEAARAGESGRGFSVVADEVRKLAEKTMDATSNVENAIRIIQNHTHESSKTMDTTIVAVQKATNEVQNAGETLSGIVNLSVSTAEEVAAIATAAEEQAMTTKDINRTITDSSQLAQNLAVSMEEATDTVKNVSLQASMLREVIENIKS